MDINNFFSKSKPNFDKLIKFGFEQLSDGYYYLKTFMRDSFELEVMINHQAEVFIRVIDLAFNEEYLGIKVENQQGEFVNKIRDNCFKILERIKQECFESFYFKSEQANRIVDLVKEKYKDSPEFLWDDIKAGVFRETSNKKWYGIIIQVDGAKIDSKLKGKVDVLNVKLDSDVIINLLKRKGFYKAYHMNKKYWISICLDNTLTDEEIMKLIIDSHKFTESINEWLIPANAKYYDMVSCFEDSEELLWKQSSNIHENDIVYLYVGVPYSKIFYKCRAIEVNIDYKYSDEVLSINKAMKLKLVEDYKDKDYNLDLLKSFGVKAIRGPRSIPKSLSTFLSGKVVKNN